jgi:hypothetical protein
MAWKNKFWVGLVSIIAISLIITFTAPISDYFKGLAALPSVVGLLIGLFQLERDHSAHERNLQLQNEHQLFNLGATSHMANTVFDKHVEFCEKYLSEVSKLSDTLIKEGPSESALNHSRTLHNIRTEYSAWITLEINEKLVPFEQAARKIGADAHLVEALSRGNDRDGLRPEAINRMYDLLKSMLSLENSKMKDEDATVVGIRNKVREILQVDQLVSIREYLIEKAVSNQNVRKRCQGRTKNVPAWRSKSVPLGVKKNGF